MGVNIYMSKILVAGGRKFGEFSYRVKSGDRWEEIQRDYEQAKAERILLNAVLIIAKPTFIVQGTANGADRMAVLWANKNGVAHSGDKYKPDWEGRGLKAGTERNRFMLKDNPDIDYIIAFDGGSGTENMKFEARKRGLFVSEPTIIKT